MKMPYKYPSYIADDAPQTIITKNHAPSSTSKTSAAYATTRSSASGTLVHEPPLRKSIRLVK